MVHDAEVDEDNGGTWRDFGGVLSFGRSVANYFSTGRGPGRVRWRWKWAHIGPNPVPYCPVCGAVTAKVKGQELHEEWHARLDEWQEQVVAALETGGYLGDIEPSAPELV